MVVYNCDKCNYSTNRHSSYIKHTKTKRHQTAIATFEFPKNETKFPKNETKSCKTDSMCRFCNKIFSGKNIYRHIKNCKDRVKLEESDKDHIIDKLKSSLQEEQNKISKLEKQFKDHVVESNKTLEAMSKRWEESTDRYEKMSKKIVEKEDTPTVNQYNMYYIINNYTNAQNIEDLMDKPLTDEEKKYFDSGSLSGCLQLLKNRCVENIDLPDRPIHCLDISRDKFLLRSEDNWKIDVNGEKIIDSAHPLIKPLYPLDKDDDIEKMIHNNDQMIALELNRKKILKELSKNTTLKKEKVPNKHKIINIK